MVQCSLSELIRISEIVKYEKALSQECETYSKTSTDPRLREIMQKCAAIHKSNYTSIENMFKE